MAEPLVMRKLLAGLKACAEHAWRGLKVLENLSEMESTAQ